MPTEETADAHADDTVVGDERIIEERSRRTRGNLRSSVSRGLSSLLTRRKSRRASDTAPNDEEDNEDGEEDGAEIAADLPMNEVEDEDADSNCIVCMDAPRDSTVLPCRHTVLCSRCAGALRYRTDVQHRCPICRTEIESVLEEDEQLKKAMEEMPWGFR